MNREFLEDLVARWHPSYGKPSPLTGLFDKQKQAHVDPAREKAICTSRRAGKSHLMAVSLWEAAQKFPGSQLPYIGLTRDSAKRIMWKVFEELFTTYNIEAEMLESKLTIKFPDNSEIFLVGADQKNFIKRLRGAKYPRVCIDELQGFGDSLIEELIDDVVTPALADYGGDIICGGTPGPTPQGMWYEMASGQRSFKPFHWTLFDNPHMPNAKVFVEEMKRKKAWTDENPTYLREWCGLWVKDMDSLVYKFNRERNLYSDLPTGFDWQRVIALDFGWNDQTAFGVLAYSSNHPKIFVEHVEGHSEMIPSDIADRVKQLQKQYQPFQIVADTGGLGKSICEEMIRRHGIPVKPAEKTEKLTNIRLLNGDFIDRKVLVHERLKKYHDQVEKLTKSDSGVEDPTLPNDLCDVVLYGWRACRAYTWQPRDKAPHQNSDAYMDKVWEQEAESIQAKEAEEAMNPFSHWGI